MAVYRSGTILRGGIAIIWISDRFIEYVKESEFDDVGEAVLLDHITVTIAHEVVHAIQDLVGLYRRRNGKLVFADFNEDEAETLGREIASGVVYNDHALFVEAKRALSELYD